MTQLEQLVYEMELRSGTITTAEILSLTPRIAQYGRVISDLKKRGYEIVCEPIKNQPTNNLFKIVRYPKEEDSIYRRKNPPVLSPDRQPGSVNSLDKKPAGFGELFNFETNQHGSTSVR